jgi:hypothetical protein
MAAVCWESPPWEIPPCEIPEMGKKRKAKPKKRETNLRIIYLYGLIWPKL